MTTQATLLAPRPMRAVRIASFTLAVLLAAVSIAGLWFGRRGLYADDPATAPAFLGQDAITLVVGIPLLLLAMRWTARRALAGLVLWMGALFYLAYSYAFYVLDPVVTPLFPVYAAVVAISVYTLLALVVGPGVDAAGRIGALEVPRKTAAAYLVGMAAVFVLMWGAMIAARLSGDTPATKVEHIVWSLDLMFALPAMLLSGVLVWRRRPWGSLFAGIMLLKATFLGFTLLVTTWLATYWGVPADLGMTAAFAVLALLGLAVFVRYLRALAPRSASEPDAPRTVVHAYP